MPVSRAASNTGSRHRSAAMVTGAPLPVMRTAEARVGALAQPVAARYGSGPVRQIPRRGGRR
jgi:hypothetical protein